MGFLWGCKKQVSVWRKGIAGWNWFWLVMSGNTTNRRELSDADFRLAGCVL